MSGVKEVGLQRCSIMRGAKSIKERCRNISNLQRAKHKRLHEYRDGEQDLSNRFMVKKINPNNWVVKQPKKSLKKK